MKSQPKHHINKTCPIGFWATAEDADNIKSEAAKTGLTISAYCRLMTLDRTPSVTVQCPIAQSQWQKLSLLASNINQMTHCLNSGITPDSDDIEVLLDEVRTELSLVRDALNTNARRS